MFVVFMADLVELPQTTSQVPKSTSYNATRSTSRIEQSSCGFIGKDSLVEDFNSRLTFAFSSKLRYHERQLLLWEMR